MVLISKTKLNLKLSARKNFLLLPTMQMVKNFGEHLIELCPILKTGLLFSLMNLYKNKSYQKLKSKKMRQPQKLSLQ
jgi:hypothetical protein